MKNTTLIFTVILLICCGAINAQKPKFKKVSKELLEQESCEYDKEAAAEYIYHGCEISFVYSDAKGGFYLEYEYHDRIKIYTEEGLDYGDFLLRYYTGDDGVSKEKIKDLEAYTFNLENGKVVEVKLDKDNIYDEQINKYYAAKKFPMPALKAGSVIDVKYRLDSPYSYLIDEFYFEQYIPVRYTEYKFSAPEYYNYNHNIKGLAPLTKVEEKKNGSFTINYKTQRQAATLRSTSSNSRFRSEAISYTKNVTNYSGKNLPGLTVEPYVYNMDNYRSSVKMELLMTLYPGRSPVYHTKDWADICKRLGESKSFGKQLDKNFKDVKDIVEGAKMLESDAEKIAYVYSSVQDRFTWNSYYALTSGKGIKNLIKEGTGTSGQINLLLVNLLNKVGVTAYPMALKTKDRGFLNVTVPSIADLNNVIAVAVDTEGNATYLDATDKDLMPNMIPTRALNLRGIIVQGTSGVEHGIVNPNSSTISKVTTVKIEDDVLSGDYKEIRKGFAAYQARSSYASVKDVEEALNTNSFTLSDVTLEGIDTNEKEVKITGRIDLENMVQQIDGKILLSMVPNEEDYNNPFVKETREFALFFSSKTSKTVMYKTSIPEGYVVESIPEKLNIAAPDKMMTYLIQVNEMNGEIVVMIRSKIKQSIITPEYYTSIKEVMDQVEAKIKEKIVLAKKT